MTGKKAVPPQDDPRRRRAEDLLRDKGAGMARTEEALTPEEARQMVHELRVHQVELELQNEELHRAQAERDAAGARYFDFYDMAPVGYFTLSERGLILEANLTAANLLDVARRDLVQQLFSRYISKEDQDIYYLHCKQLFEKAAPQSWEMRMLKKDGTVFWARLEAIAAKDADGVTVCRTVISDITERKRAENDLIETVQQLQEAMDMLIQFEREAAIGRLAADVANEIINPASIISSRLQFLEEESLSEPARGNVRISREQLLRIVKISQDLQQSSPKQPGMLVRSDLRHVVEVGLQMTERRREKDLVRIEYDPPLKSIPVKMAVDKLVKVLIHIIHNACDAMTVNKEKKLIVTVGYHEAPSQRRSVHLTVADNGQGIPAGYLNRIFDPFFTTKDPGKGTGLGLSVCRSIILEHGGAIRAVNNDMGGASFIVELPLYQS